jgi:ribosomal protein L19E
MNSTSLRKNLKRLLQISLMLLSLLKKTYKKNYNFFKAGRITDGNSLKKFLKKKKNQKSSF